MVAKRTVSRTSTCFQPLATPFFLLPIYSLPLTQFLKNKGANFTRLEYFDNNKTNNNKNIQYALCIIIFPSSDHRLREMLLKGFSGREAEASRSLDQ